MTTVQCCRSALLLMTDPWRACFCIFTLRSYRVNWELQQGLWLQLLETGQGKCTLIILKPLIQRISSCYCFPCTVWFLERPVEVVHLVDIWCWMPYSLKKKQTILHRIGKHMLLNDHSTMLSFCFTADDRSLTCLFLYLHFAKLPCQLRATARALTPAFGDWTG